MKKLTLLMVGTLLSGCVANNVNDFQAKLSVQNEQELAAMRTAGKESVQKCGKGKRFEDIPRAQAMKYNACSSAIFRDHVLTVAAYPKPFNEFLDEYSGYVSIYSKGKMSLKELMDSKRIALNTYLSKKETLIRPVMAEMAGKDDLERKQLKSLADSIAENSRNEQQRWKDSMPVNTTCSIYGNTAHCSSSQY